MKEKTAKRRKQTAKRREQTEDSKYQQWKKFMELGEYTGCHQYPERSFFYKGYQFPVCARCTGVYLGYLAAIPVYFAIGFKKVKLFAIFGCDLMLVDWLLQAYNIKESNNIRRFITGITGDLGLMLIYMELIRKVFRYIIKFRTDILKNKQAK